PLAGAFSTRRASASRHCHQVGSRGPRCVLDVLAGRAYLPGPRITFSRGRPECCVSVDADWWVGRRREQGCGRRVVGGQRWLWPVTRGLQGALKATAGEHRAQLRYPGALPDVSLDYAVRADGLEETLTLAKGTVPTEYRFTLDPHGVPLSPRQLANGSWAFM